MTSPCGAYDQQSCEETRLSLTLEDQDMLCSSCNLGREHSSAPGLAGRDSSQKDRGVSYSSPSEPPAGPPTAGELSTSTHPTIARSRCKAPTQKAPGRAKKRGHCWGCGRDMRISARGLCSACYRKWTEGTLTPIELPPLEVAMKLTADRLPMPTPVNIIIDDELIRETGCDRLSLGQPKDIRWLEDGSVVIGDLVYAPVAQPEHLRIRIIIENAMPPVCRARGYLSMKRARAALARHGIETTQSTAKELLRKAGCRVSRTSNGWLLVKLGAVKLAA